MVEGLGPTKSAQEWQAINQLKQTEETRKKLATLAEQFQQELPQYTHSEPYTDRRGAEFVFLSPPKPVDSEVSVPTIQIYSGGDGFSITVGESRFTTKKKPSLNKGDFLRDKYRKNIQVIPIREKPDTEEQYRVRAWRETEVAEAAELTQRFIEGVILDEEFLHTPASWAQSLDEPFTFRDILKSRILPIVATPLPVAAERLAEVPRRTYALSEEEMQKLTLARLDMHPSGMIMVPGFGIITKEQAVSEVEANTPMGKKLQRSAKLAIEAVCRILSLEKFTAPNQLTTNS